MKFIADQNFDAGIVRGLRRQLPEIDLVTALDAGVSTFRDVPLLAWSEEQNRILLTHDKKSMPGHLRELLEQGDHTPGILVVSQSLSIGDAIEEILTVIECTSEKELRDQLWYLPL